MNDFEVLADALVLQGRTVVDVGCGDGSLVRALRAAGADALGVDVDVARAREIDPEGRYLPGGAQELPLEDASVDVAVLMRSLHHVPDPRTAFPELRRVVREFVYVAEPLPEGAFFELLRPVDDETEVRAKAQAAIADSGFERVRTFEYEFTMQLERFEQFEARVLGADPSRAEDFAQLEPDLRLRFSPGEYTMPMRVDLLKP